ncbi:MAG: hypothetical protein WEB00_01880 [Dehalococcoidia bacterium]
MKTRAILGAAGGVALGLLLFGFVGTASAANHGGVSSGEANFSAPDQLTWHDILPGVIPAPRGWTVTVNTYGNYLDIHSDGREIATNGVELFRYPLESFTDIDPSRGNYTLRQFARNYYRIFREDRAAGYGDAYIFTADPIVQVQFGGLKGIRFGFTGRLNGEVFDRYVNYVAFDSEYVYLIATTHDKGSEGIFGFDRLADLRTFEPYLLRLVGSLTLGR